MRKPSLLGLVLVIIGLFWLAKNLNLLPEHWLISYGWYFRQYWPVLVILGGIRILVRRAYPGLALILNLLIIFALIAALLYWFSAGRGLITI